MQINSNDQKVSFDILKDIRDSMREEKIKIINSESLKDELLTYKEKIEKNGIELHIDYIFKQSQ